MIKEPLVTLVFGLLLGFVMSALFDALSAPVWVVYAFIPFGSAAWVIGFHRKELGL